MRAPHLHEHKASWSAAFIVVFGLCVLLWPSSAWAGIAYRYSPIGGELRFVRNRENIRNPMNLPHLPSASLFSPSFGPSTSRFSSPRSLNKASSNDLLANEEEDDLLTFTPGGRSSSVFASFLRQWTSRSGGRNWRNFIKDGSGSSGVTSKKRRFQ